MPYLCTEVLPQTPNTMSAKALQGLDADAIRDLAIAIVEHICDTDETFLAPEVREVLDADGERLYTEDTFAFQDCIAEAIAKHLAQ